MIYDVYTILYRYFPQQPREAREHVQDRTVNLVMPAAKNPVHVPSVGTILAEMPLTQSKRILQFHLQLSLKLETCQRIMICIRLKYPDVDEIIDALFKLAQ